VDDPHRIKPGFPTGVQVFFQQAGYVSGGKGVKVQDIFDGDPDGSSMIAVTGAMLHKS
jgi:hypothetical protein